MFQKLNLAGLAVMSAIVAANPAARAEVPNELSGAWLPLDGFASLTKPEERPTCIGGKRALGIEILDSEGVWSTNGGGLSSQCAFDTFQKQKNGWTSVGECNVGYRTKVVVNWRLTHHGSRLTTATKYDQGDTLVLHYRRCTLKEKIAGIALPLSVYDKDADESGRRLFQINYARIASKLCPRLAFDEDRATVTTKEAEGRILANALGAVDVDEDDTQIANREVFCGELLKRFGKNGTLVQGLVIEKAAPL